MKGRSTSWFDGRELKALFKGVKPARPGAAGAGSSFADAPVEREPLAGEAPDAAPPSSPSAPPVPPVEAEPEAAPTSAPTAELLPERDLPGAPPGASPDERVPPPSSLEPGTAPAEAAVAAPQLEPGPVPVGVVEPRPEPSSLPSPVPDLTSESLWRQSEALLHLARGQAASQALEERLWEITETAAAVLSLARASVWTFEDEERTRLHCADFFSAIRDVHESGQVQAARDYPLYFAALHSQRPIVAHDAKADARTRELAGGSLSPSQSRIEAPVIVAGRLAGVVRLEHEGSPRRFEHHEERFAASLADLTGLALEAQEGRLKEAVARVGEERVRAQRDALAELSRGDALVRGHLEGVLHEVTEAAARVLRLERASVWIYAPDYQSLFCLDAFERAAARHGRGAEIVGARAPRYFESLRAGGRLSLLDAREEPRLAELVNEGHVPPGISSRLEVPIHLVGRLAGVLWCERVGSPRPWLADEERFAEALAGFVALVIATSERRRTESELRRALEDLDRPSPAPAGEALAPAPSRFVADQAPDAFDEDLGDSG